jgi:hypothetical protein
MSDVIRDLPPDLTLPPRAHLSRRERGGSYGHKDPNCACISCKARRRKEEALALTAGTGGGTLEVLVTDPEAVLNADFPLIAQDLTSPRARVAQWITLRAAHPGITNKDIALKLGLQPRTLNAIITRAVKEGWLKVEDPLERVEYELVPRTIDNLKQFLDEGDKQVTIEVAKGTIFQSYKESKGLGDQSQTVLALKIEAPPGLNVKVAMGQIVGAPRSVEDEPEKDV